MNSGLPRSFDISFRKLSAGTFQLTTSQTIPLSPERAFTFFEDPRNLFEITPDWLDFRLANPDTSEVSEGSEFDYTIRWCGIRMRWRSRIIDYLPPERFTDIQIRGPYRSWHHLHTFEGRPEGTLLRDVVTYKPPLIGVPFHDLMIRGQLTDIFSYRAVRIAEWAGGDFRPKALRRP